jgi:hypothetical protein
MCVAFEWAGAILSQNIKWLEDPAKNLAVDQTSAHNSAIRVSDIPGHGDAC